MKRLVLVLGLFLTSKVAQSAFDESTITREFAWSPAEGEGVPTAHICPLKYDKRWAYSVEIDDGPGSTTTVSQPLLARFAFTDAPPGIAGGKALPFVGCAAVFPARVDVGGPEYLSWAQLRDLKSKGWDVVNHGYAHSGNSWEPNGSLTDGEVCPLRQ